MIFSSLRKPRNGESCFIVYPDAVTGLPSDGPPRLVNGRFAFHAVSITANGIRSSHYMDTLSELPYWRDLESPSISWGQPALRAFLSGKAISFTGNTLPDYDELVNMFAEELYPQ